MSFYGRNQDWKIRGWNLKLCQKCAENCAIFLSRKFRNGLYKLEFHFFYVSWVFFRDKKTSNTITSCLERNFPKIVFFVHVLTTLVVKKIGFAFDWYHWKCYIKFNVPWGNFCQNSDSFQNQYRTLWANTWKLSYFLKFLEAKTVSYQKREKRYRNVNIHHGDLKEFSV